MTYEAALAYMASLAPRGWRLGLDRMEAFVERLGLTPSVRGDDVHYVHTAGTNGKGSTTAFVQNLLYYSGLPTGAFFSPFVYDPRERIQLGKEMISEESLADLTDRLIPIAESMSETDFGGITEFEFKTAMGFMAWKEAGTKWVALETGLGGRLDATNVVDPVASIVVSIGLDHQSILGDTREEIAFEKAGIIKPGRPAVLGEIEPGPLEVLRKAAAERSCPTYEYGRNIRWEGSVLHTPFASFDDAIPRRLFGSRQPHNFGLAVTAVQAAGVELTVEAVRAAARETVIPGRFEQRSFGGVQVLLDGAHNEESARVLAESVRAQYDQDSRFVLITNMVAGHEQDAFYRPIADLIGRAVVPPIDFHRARTPDETVSALRGIGVQAESAVSAESALVLAIDLARRANCPVLVTGSFYLVGEIGRTMDANGDRPRR